MAHEKPSKLSMPSKASDQVLAHNPQAALDADKPLKAVLKQAEHVRELVEESAAELSLVNVALAAEIGARHALEAELASITQEEQEARHAAFHDPLTGLPNRALFDNRLAHGLAQAKRHDRILAVMFLDLDDFKQVNDSYGHDVGDAVLEAVAQRLKENVRDDDTICRLGGDEFLYLCTEIDSAQDAVQIAEKIAAAIGAPCPLRSGFLSVTPSIGIALFPIDGTTPMGLIKSADVAMYKAKRNQSGYAFASGG